MMGERASHPTRTDNPPKTTTGMSGSRARGERRQGYYILVDLHNFLKLFVPTVFQIFARCAHRT